MTRRFIIFTVFMGTLFVLTTALNAIWPPLAWVVPILGAMALVVLIAAAMTGHWPGRSGTTTQD
jgi:hypothetical protein